MKKMIYSVDGSICGLEEAVSLLLCKQDCQEHNYMNLYDESLDDCYGEIKLGEKSYPASLVLARVDRQAYLKGLSVYAEAFINDNREYFTKELYGMMEGEVISFGNCKVRCVQDDVSSVK